VKRKYETLDVVNMFSSLSLEQWEHTLRKAVKSQSVNKLIAWRYGLQAGLADAVSKGFKNDKLDLWVMKRCRDIEQCVKFIIKKRNPDPKIDLKKDDGSYIKKVKAAKMLRNKELEKFFMESNF
jgi:hypothetical protein